MRRYDVLVATDAVPINPRSLKGKHWAAGFCLDLHTTSSEFLGHNAYGHAEFRTVYSPIGKYLYKLKYRGDRSAMDPIVEALRDVFNFYVPPRLFEVLRNKAAVAVVRLFLAAQ